VGDARKFSQGLLRGEKVPARHSNHLLSQGGKRNKNVGKRVRAKNVTNLGAPGKGEKIRSVP